MGRILGHRAARRMFVGVLALAGLALAACEPLKPAPEPPPVPNVPPICVPNSAGGNPGAFGAAAVAPAPDPGCTPICLPGQEPQNPTANLQPAPAPTTPDCVPICPPSDGGGGQPQLKAQARVRCLRIPIPCVPGVDIPGCTNFCPPGQGQPAPSALDPTAGQAFCTPLCVLIPKGLPGACAVFNPLPRN